MSNLNLLYNTVFENKPVSLTQINDTFRLTEDIIENLDTYALSQLVSGNESDIDDLLEVILKESFEVLNGSSIKFEQSRIGHLDKMAESIDETFRNESFNYFVATCIPNFQQNWHNLEWGQLVQMYRFLNVIAARDHSKSYTFSYAYPLWKMYRYQKSTPTHKVRREFELSKRGMLITNEHSLAKLLLSIIREGVEENDILREKLLPNNTRENWGKEEITCKNGANLVIKSFGSKMRGNHPGYIICDDYLNDSVLFSKDQRDKYVNIFKGVIENMILPGGQIVVAGTPYHEDDLYAYLKRNKKWKVFEYPAVFPDGSVLWESRYSLQDILDKKESQGSTIFSREILVKPISDDSSLFPYSILSKCFHPNLKLVNNAYSLQEKKYKGIYMGCDFAFSANVGADFSCYVTIGVDEFNNYDILHIYREKGKTFSEQMAAIKMLYSNFRHTSIMMESVQAQTIFAQEAEKAGLPIIPHSTTAKSKYSLDDGLPSLQVMFENQKIRFPRGDEYSINQTDIMVSELASMSYTDKGLQGVGAHDDTVMGLLFAVKAAKKGGTFDFMFI